MFLDKVNLCFTTHCVKVLDDTNQLRFLIKQYQQNRIKVQFLTPENPPKLSEKERNRLRTIELVDQRT